MKKIVLFTLVLGLFAFAKTASAAISCAPIYGGGQTCVQTGNILINKQVLNPMSNQFVDNLGVNDPKFGPDTTVTFQLVVTNTGNAPFSRVNIKDIFPQFVGFAGGPGNFDGNSKILTFSLDNLNPGESRTFTVQGHVDTADKLPSDQAVVCVVNQAIANTNDNQRSQDNSQFCITKQVLAAAPEQPQQPGFPTTTKGGVVITQPAPGTTKGGLKVFPPQPVTSTPPTGPEMIPLLALLPSGALGFFLRKKSK